MDEASPARPPLPLPPTPLHAQGSSHLHATPQPRSEAPRQSSPLSLNKIPPTFSFSAYLTHAPPSESSSENSPDNLNHDDVNNQINIDIHPTKLIALALNEECRSWGYGRVFYLPMQSRQDTAQGHPTDLVYFPTIWTEVMKSGWDMSSWEQRLEGCEVGESLVNLWI